MVEDVVAQRVEGARDPGPHLARPEHVAVLRGRGGDHRAADARPPGRQRGVQESDEVDHVGRGAPGRQAVEGGVDREADQPDPAVVVDEHVLGDEPAVGHPGVVGEGQRVGHLRDDPGGDGRRERLAVGQQDVEAGAGAPLVDHEAAVGGLVDVEHPQHPPVEDRGGGAGGLAEQGGAVVVAGDDVHGDVALQHLVEGAPEAAARALGQQVGQSVPVGEHVAGPVVLRHPVPFRLPAPILGVSRPGEPVR